MGQFTDAFKSGQNAKQAEIEKEQRKQADQAQKLLEAAENARGWVTNVLQPVLAEATNDLASIGTIKIRENSNPPRIMQEIVIAIHGKPPSQMAFLIDETGAVHFYRNQGAQNTIGSVTTVNQTRIRQVISETLEAIGRV